MKQQPSSAFSLVEVTLAIGIAAFCLIAVLGLLPVGVQTNRNATSQTRATNIIAAVVADLRATPATSTTSSQFRIQFGQSKDLYFDNTGGFVPDTPDANSRYHLNITFPSSPTGLAYADVKVTWPAAAATTSASGSVEMFAALDRR
jgi:uncharacterized protein (TIGR02598 family)